MQHAQIYSIEGQLGTLAEVSWELTSGQNSEVPVLRQTTTNTHKLQTELATSSC